MHPGAFEPDNGAAAEEKLRAIAEIYDRGGSTNARSNLEGALIDLDAGRNDEVSRNTIRRVIDQLGRIEDMLPVAAMEVDHG